jgi:2-keto-4-pentenoate hydratase
MYGQLPSLKFGPMQTNPYATFVEALGEARLAGAPLPELSETHRPLSESQGYEAQTALAEWFKKNGQGEIAGYKVGATTEGMQNYLGVKTPAYGHIMSNNILSAGAQVYTKKHCPIGVECELAILFGSELPSSDGPLMRDDLAKFVDAVAPAIEIVENRYGDFQSSGLGTLVADDFFHRACVLGEPIKDWQQVDLPSISAGVVIDGKEVENGNGAMVLGDPLEAVIWLLKKFRNQGRSLQAGAIVLTGSMTPVRWVEKYPTHVEINLSDIGSCSLDLI